MDIVCTLFIVNVLSRQCHGTQCFCHLNNVKLTLHSYSINAVIISVYRHTVSTCIVYVLLHMPDLSRTHSSSALFTGSQNSQTWQNYFCSWTFSIASRAARNECAFVVTENERDIEKSGQQARKVVRTKYPRNQLNKKLGTSDEIYHIYSYQHWLPTNFICTADT